MFNIRMSLSDFKELMLPWKAKDFFRKVHPRPVLDNIRYVLILGLFTFVGYFLLYSVFGAQVSVDEGPMSMTIELEYSLEDGALLALDHYIYAVSTPIVLGLLMTLFGKTISGRRVPLEESMTISCYAYTPALIFGILAAFFGGVGELVGPLFLPSGIIILSLGQLYAAILLYYAAKASFEKNRAYLYIIGASFVNMAVLSFILPILTGWISRGAEPLSMKETLSYGGDSMIFG